VRYALMYLPVFQNDDAIGVGDRRQPMRNNEGGSQLLQIVESPLHRLLPFGGGSENPTSAADDLPPAMRQAKIVPSALAGVHRVRSQRREPAKAVPFHACE
jgi:hypothetical protein